MKKENKSKIFGAVMSSLFYEIFLIMMICFICYLQFFDDEKIPWLLFFIIIILFLSFAVSLFVSLINRIKEIKGGEEDEASKY